MRLVEEVLQSNVPKTIDEAKHILSDFAERIGFDQFSYVRGQAFRPDGQEPHRRRLHRGEGAERPEAEALVCSLVDPPGTTRLLRQS